MNKSAVPEDGKLYQSFLDGDTTAYDQLMIRHGDSLTLYLYGYMHDWQDAEDLMIEAFARIMVKKPRIQDGSFKAYLFKTARNLASRFHSRKTRMMQISFDDIENDLTGHELVEERIISDEQKRALGACLERIDPLEKEALWLVYIERMSYAEAAEVMKVNTKKIDHLLSRGKQSMKKELMKEGITNAID